MRWDSMTDNVQSQTTAAAWMEGYEAAKKQAAKAMEHAAFDGFPDHANTRLRAARMIRGMQPKERQA